MIETAVIMKLAGLQKYLENTFGGIKKIKNKANSKYINWHASLKAMTPITHFEVDPAPFGWVSRNGRESETSILFMPKWQQKKKLKICIEMTIITRELHEIDRYHWLISHHIRVIT